jgi:hypothetical protein
VLAGDISGCPSENDQIFVPAASTDASAGWTLASQTAAMTIAATPMLRFKTAGTAAEMSNPRRIAGQLPLFGGRGGPFLLTENLTVE